MNINAVKKSFLFFAILIVGLISINSFLFPKIDESCTCRMGEEIGQILCAGICTGQGCGIATNLGGYCEGSSCITQHTIRCVGSTTRYVGEWSEPCWSCWDW